MDGNASPESRRSEPFIYSEARFARYLNIADECAQARVIAMEQKQ